MKRLVGPLAALVVMGGGSSAEARPIEGQDDPALTDALQHGFEGIEDASVSAAAFVVGDTLVTVSGGGETPDDVLISCIDDASCQLLAYDYTPTVLTFDPPIAAIGLDLQYSTDYWTLEAVGSLSTETIDAQLIGWQYAMAAFAGAAEIGGISEVRLSVDQYASFWDELFIVEGGAVAGPADVSLRLLGHDAEVTNGGTFQIDVTATAEGPGDLASCEVLVFPPAGSEVLAASQPGVIDALPVSFDFGPLPVGDSRDAMVDMTAPDETWLSCDDTLRTIAIVRGATGEGIDRSDDIVSATAVLDRSGLPNNEDCASLRDDDCDGLFNCLDDDCIGEPQCPAPQLSDLVQSPWPPIIPWLPVDPEGNPDLEALFEVYDPFDQIGPSQQCKIGDGHGGMMNAQPMCCAPAPPSTSNQPSYVEWLQRCTPLDPNYKTAIPATNGVGMGSTAAGERIEYTITYENIGGVDAHDVIVLDTLSPELDDSTLELIDGGVYDEATRTLTWIDPVLPPGEPHQVHFAIEVRGDAGPGTRVQNYGTVIFQDAVPPSREDTLPIVHTIPVPGTVARPELGIAACTSLGGDAWRIDVVNAGLGFAYDVSARVIEAPEGFVVTDDSCRVAHPDDVDPEIISVVVPWATTPALDEIVFSAPAEVEDPCSELLFELVYFTPQGEEITAQVRVDGDGVGGGGVDSSGTDADGGSDGSGEGSGGGGVDGEGGGCGCTTSPRGGGAMLGVVVLMSLRRRRRAA